MSHVVRSSDVKLESVGEGVQRRVLSYSDNIMVVEVNFKKNSIGAVHSHTHEQCSYVKKGKFEFEIDDKKEIVEEGDSIYFSPNSKHGTLCLEEGTVIDIFTPKREDFLS